MRVRRPLVSMTTIAVLLAMPGAASAATAEMVVLEDTGGTVRSELRYAAKAGERNATTVRIDATTVQVADGGALIQAGAHCTPLAPNAVECMAPGPDCSQGQCHIFPYLVGVVLEMGNGHDTVIEAGSEACTTQFQCLTSHAAIRVHGGPGNDHVQAGRGGADYDDEVYGGPGNDTIVQGTGPLHAFCGPGHDTVVVDPVQPAHTSDDCELVVPGT